MLLGMWRSKQAFVAAVVLLLVVLVGVLAVVKDRVDGCLFCSGRAPVVFPASMVGDWSGSYLNSDATFSVPIEITIPSGGGQATVQYFQLGLGRPSLNCQDVLDADGVTGGYVKAREDTFVSGGCAASQAGEWTLQVESSATLIGAFVPDGRIYTGTATLNRQG
jgi:hypothetical protein